MFMCPTPSSSQVILRHIQRAFSLARRGASRLPGRQVAGQMVGVNP